MNNKRKNYFIEKKFQTKYILLIILLLISYSFIFVCIIFAPYMLTLYFDYPLAEKADAARVILLLHGRIWPLIGAVILSFGVISLLVSHRIAGPLFHIKQSLSEVRKGNLDIVVRLRRSDDLKDLAESVNQLIEELRTFVNTLRNDYDLLSDYIQELEQKIETKDLTEESGREIINRVRASRKNIESALEKFNIPQ